MAKVSHHKRLDLAKRHARKVERETESKVILHRRNAKGQFSKRGQFYTFEIQGQSEYQINMRYKPGGKVKAEVQISAQGPAGASREEVIEAVQERQSSGDDKEGWTVKIVDWKKKGEPVTTGDKANSEESWAALQFPFAKTLRKKSKKRKS